MITADYVALFIALAALLFGFAMGFGKSLRFITKGIVGQICCVIICWFLFGVVLDWAFVQNILASFIGVLEANGSGFCNFLITIRIDAIVLFIALFLIVQILRLIIVSLISRIFDTDNKVLKAIDKTAGILILACYFAVIALIIFQIAFMISGAEGGLYNVLKGSALKLDVVYQNNPLNSFIEVVLNKG